VRSIYRDKRAIEKNKKKGKHKATNVGVEGKHKWFLTGQNSHFKWPRGFCRVGGGGGSEVERVSRTFGGATAEGAQRVE